MLLQLTSNFLLSPWESPSSDFSYGDFTNKRLIYNNLTLAIYSVNI